MRSFMMTSASLALFIGVAACSSTPKEPAPVVTPDPVVEEVVEEFVEPIVRDDSMDNIVTEPTGPAKGSLQDFQVNVGDRVYFDLDQYRLGADAQDILKRQAAWLSSYPGVNILVAGNCDERGTREYNLALGERRASIVKNYLVSLGVDEARIQTVSYGKEKPLAIGSNDDSWAQNRNGFTQLLDGVVG
ncbi:MAG: peptidoglycan-associated lipoprotein Pal [Henriciella sp.]|jgi:peptidoglycan-associated lipoprotein